MKYSTFESTQFYHQQDLFSFFFYNLAKKTYVSFHLSVNQIETAFFSNNACNVKDKTPIEFSDEIKLEISFLSQIKVEQIFRE